MLYSRPARHRDNNDLARRPSIIAGDRLLIKYGEKPSRRSACEESDHGGYAVCRAGRQACIGTHRRRRPSIISSGTRRRIGSHLRHVVSSRGLTCMKPVAACEEYRWHSGENSVKAVETGAEAFIRVGSGRKVPSRRNNHERPRRLVMRRGQAAPASVCSMAGQCAALEK